MHKLVGLLSATLALAPALAIAQTKGGTKPPATPVAPKAPTPTPISPAPAVSPGAAKPTGAAAEGLKTSDVSFSTRDAFELMARKSQKSNERLAPRLKPLLDPNGSESAAFQKEMNACSPQGEGQEVNTTCLERVLKGIRAKRGSLTSGGIDLAAEAAKVRQELGEPPDDPSVAQAPPDLAIVTESATSATAAPLGNVAQSIPLTPTLLSSEGSRVAYYRANNAVSQRCHSAEIGACYKRATLGGTFPVPKGMRRGMLRTNLTVNGSIAVVSWLAYTSAEVKISLYVGSEQTPVCSLSKSLGHLVAPVFGGAVRRFENREVMLACPFPIDPSYGPYESKYRIVVENWSGAGGLGAVASSSAVTTIRSAVIDLSPVD